MTITEILTPSYDAAWLPWAVQYFFFIGAAATGAIITACLVFAHNKESIKRLLPTAMTVLLASSICAPIALLADLAQPARFWHVYAYFAPWSWMSIGAILLPIFIILVLLLCLTWWLGKTNISRIISVLLIISAISILVYTGSEVMILRSRPLWHTYYLPINFALTGALSFMGAILFVARWLPGGIKNMSSQLVKNISLGIITLLVFFALLWVVTGLTGKESSFHAAIEIFSNYPAWEIALIGSLLLALVIFLMVRAPAHYLNNYWYSLIAGTLMMGAAWFFRWIILMSIQGIPKYGAGLYLYSFPWGSDGFLGIIGVFGLCFALLAVVTWFLEQYPAKQSLNLS